MSFFDVLTLMSFLVTLWIISRVFNALRILEERVTLLHELVGKSRDIGRRGSGGSTRPATDSSLSDGARTTHVIDDPEVEEFFKKMDVEQERLKKAMGRDFRTKPTPLRRPMAPPAANSKPDASKAPPSPGAPKPRKPT